VSFGKRPQEASQIVANALNLTADHSTDNETTTATTSTAIATASSEFSYLASGSRDRTVRLWNAVLGQCLMVFTAHDSWVRSVVLHPSGKYILSCSDDKTVRVMDIKENRCMRTINEAHSHFITCMAFSAAHNSLVTGSVDKNISVWSCS
jgi:platelet-activating factor acetylhydrolase IB subunit alpha